MLPLPAQSKLASLFWPILYTHAIPHLFTAGSFLATDSRSVTEPVRVPDTRLIISQINLKLQLRWHSDYA